VVRVEKAQNFLVGLFAAMVFENFHVNLRLVFLAEALGELDAAVDSVIVANEAADEADYDRWRRKLRVRFAGKLPRI